MEELSAELLRWYDQNARTLPWRGIQDPYRTWVSEIMLQQTRVDTVIPYYLRFLEAFPTLRALAAAPEDEVLKQWEGLGYYSRARNLWLGARQVLSEFDGLLPDNPAVLQTIRGIGPYTARAVASIAFGVRTPAVDGNVIRVLSRVYGIRENPLLPQIRARLEALADALVPAERPGDYNQAVMDLGATVCVPGTPDCDRCPLRPFCDAYQKGDAALLPKLPVSKPPRELQWDVAVLFSGDRVLMRQRTEKLLQGLWCFPMLEGSLPADRLPQALSRRLKLPVESLAPAGQARHVFTHQIWKMTLYTGSCPEGLEAPAGYRWIPLREFSALALPTAMKAPAALVTR